MKTRLVNEAYIVRVYRRGERHEELTGLVETIGKEKSDRFNSIEELKEIIMAENSGIRGRFYEGNEVFVLDSCYFSFFG